MKTSKENAIEVEYTRWNHGLILSGGSPVVDDEDQLLMLVCSFFLAATQLSDLKKQR